VPRAYQSWAYPSKYVVPDWARDRSVWERAFDVLGREPPEYDGGFLHRDFAPRNLLWMGEEITGVVDWVETSWGPAWLDVAHYRTMLAVSHGTEVADRFASTYQRLTGREPQPYFDVMDVVGLLPAPGRQPFLTDAGDRARLESHLVTLL
jgi:aminoglycoside/choline kinase family phosphotransferase